MFQSFWWCSYGDFVADESSLYPLACQVVAQYRRLAGWSCADLASRLGITVRAVNRAEREGLGLDSVSRLRELSSLLMIPLVLLGLCEALVPAGWWKQDYEPWQPGPDGWPAPGCIVKFYRKLKSWTQEQLASALGITALAVRKMENMNIGLDSLTRRRALQFLLAIPPVLLGLDSKYITKEVGEALIGSSKIPASELVTLFRTSANTLFAGYYQGHAQDQVESTLAWLQDAREVRMQVRGSQRSEMLQVESLGYQALANIERERSSDATVFEYTNKGVRLARDSGNSDMLVVALQRRAETLLDRGYIDLAQRSINEALSLSPHDESLLICRYVASARILSAVATDEQDRSAVYGLLDQSRPVTAQDTFHLHCDREIVTIRQAQSYNFLASHAPELQGRTLLRKSEDLLINLSPNSPRRAILAKIALAQAFIGQGELDSAAILALEALPLMDQIKSSLYLPQLFALHSSLCKSKLRHDPSVARLGLYLHEHGAL